MWAQLIKSRIKPGKEEEARGLSQEFQEGGQNGGAGWLRMIAMQNQNDPNESYTLIVFESEEKARENERSPEQAHRFQRLQEIFESPEFVDLNVVYEGSR